jgi:hypothetical protein
MIARHLSFRARDTFGDVQFFSISRKCQAAFKKQRHAAHLPFRVLDQCIAVPFVRAPMFQGPLVIGAVFYKAALNPRHKGKSSGFRLIRIRWWCEVESILREWLIYGHLPDCHGMSGPGDFVLGGTPVSNLPLLSHHYPVLPIHPQKNG